MLSYFFLELLCCLVSLFQKRLLQFQQLLLQVLQLLQVTCTVNLVWLPVLELIKFKCYISILLRIYNYKSQVYSSQIKMYMGKGAALAKKQAKDKKSQMAKAEVQKNVQKIKELYVKFQENLNRFAKEHKNEINSDSKFRQKFSDMCIQFDVNPMLAQKSIWSELGLGDFYHHLAMNILDICAKNRHQNGGLMKIKQIIEIYQRKQKQQISKNDVIRAMSKTGILGNASIVGNQFVCTVPIELNNYLNDLLAVSQKFGFISAKLMASQYKWSQDEFEARTLDLRRKGVIWIDKKVPSGPHYYFLTQMGTDFQKFASFMAKY